MASVTLEEISHFRSKLATYPDILKALDVIEDCEGDLEDAALVLAIEVGQQPDSAGWLDGFAKRYRPALCEQAVRENLLNGELAAVVEYVTENQVLPLILVAPVLMYIIKQGVNDFCEPLELKL